MIAPLCRALRATALALPLAVLGSAQPAPSNAQTDLTERRVPFLTLRNITGSADPGTHYGDERSALTAGYCRVRELDFQGFSAITDAAPPFIREEFLSVDQVIRTVPEAIYRDLAARTPDAPTLYVHGYYISFEKGCRRAILLEENARLNGRFLWFSWPSDGGIAFYTHDEADMYWSVPDLADTIIELHRRYGPGVVDVAGHSLGARGVVLALMEVAHRQPGLRLDEVVLLAPDVDFGIFERMLPRIAPLVDNITIYVTTGDRPLAVSEQLHGYPRLGQAGNPVGRLSGVEVIDLSDLSVGGPTGHLYHIYSGEVGADLDRLLNDGAHAGERPNLVRSGANIWRLRPAQE